MNTKSSCGVNVWCDDDDDDTGEHAPWTSHYDPISGSAHISFGASYLAFHQVTPEHLEELSNLIEDLQDGIAAACRRAEARRAKLESGPSDSAASVR